MYEVYSPTDVDIAIGGVNIDGWDSITISKDVDNTTRNIGADGPVGITYTANQTGMFELEVQQQNSPVNRMCAAWQQAQDLNHRPVYADVTVTEKSGGVLSYMKNCYLDSPAEQGLTAEAGSRTWGFFVTKVQYVPDTEGSGTTKATEALARINSILNNSTNRQQ